MDAVIVVADHSAFDFAEIVRHSNLIIDTRKATSGIAGACKKIFLPERVLKGQFVKYIYCVMNNYNV